MHIERSATIRLPLPAAQALPLFTAEGERDWVPGWEPVAIHAPGGSLTGSGAVFRTAAKGEETLWLVQRYDPLEGVAEYVRVTPGNRLGTVHVRCDADGDGRSTVTATYRLTALSPAGEAALAAVTEEAFAADLAGWQRAIEELLARRGESDG